MSMQNILLTSHKGVDLHAATALRVMQERLDGGERLRALHRCEMHAFGADAGVAMADLLDRGRYYNPNKHHYGHFVLEETGSWPSEDATLPAAWPGKAASSDLPLEAELPLLLRLTGGAPPAGTCAVDVTAWSRDAAGPVLSGVLWRLVVEGAGEEAAALGARLAVARGRKEGLLVNPHMECWSLAAR